MAHNICVSCSTYRELSKSAKICKPKFSSSKKVRTKVQNLTPNICSPRGFGRQFCHRTIGGLSPCLSSKIGDLAPSPNFWGIFSEFWCSDLATLQANATFGKTMEQVRNRQNTYLRSEFTPSAKFLALGITPLDSDHAECIGCKHDGSSSHLPCYPSDNHQSRNAVYWRTVNLLFHYDVCICLERLSPK